MRPLFEIQACDESHDYEPIRIRYRSLRYRRAFRGQTATPVYRLIGTILSATGSTAIIQHMQTQQTYHRSLGENIGDATLVDIQSKQIMLKRDGEQTTLTLPPHLWLGK